MNSFLFWRKHENFLQNRKLYAIVIKTWFESSASMRELFPPPAVCLSSSHAVLISSHSWCKKFECYRGHASALLVAFAASHIPWSVSSKSLLAPSSFNSDCHPVKPHPRRSHVHSVSPPSNRTSPSSFQPEHPLSMVAKSSLSFLKWSLHSNTRWRLKT